MSNRRKLSFIAVVLFFASCHNDVPGLPTPQEVEGYKYCKYKNKENKEPCESTYKTSKKDCETIGGKLFNDALCTVPFEE